MFMDRELNTAEMSAILVLIYKIQTNISQNCITLL